MSNPCCLSFPCSFSYTSVGNTCVNSNIKRDLVLNPRNFSERSSIIILYTDEQQKSRTLIGREEFASKHLKRGKAYERRVSFRMPAVQTSFSERFPFKRDRRNPLAWHASCKILL